MHFSRSLILEGQGWAMSVNGTSRQIAAAQYFGRFWSEADIQRAALTEADL
jgi:hypothetical protein